jgi:Tfp pilus assembly protein PilF
MKENGFAGSVVLNADGGVLKDQAGVLGYYSWGSNDPAIKARHLGLVFVPGALAGMYVSSDGRTFAEPPAGWNLGTWEDKSSYFGGSPQSLAGDLIREGVTGIAGHVAEPFLEATIRPDILFPAYLSGFNLVESFYLATPFLSWQTVVIGDPLCAPFRTRALTTQEIDKGADPTTELPAWFSERRVRLLTAGVARQSPGMVDAIKLMMRAEARFARQDLAGARQALEEATSRDDRLAPAQLLLASIYEQQKEYDGAIGRYRKLLEYYPDNVLALNNLAYALAVRRGAPVEALPLAEKAYGLARDNPNIADTLGWIRHLIGESEKARGLLETAAQAAPQNAEIHLHFAVVLAALGQNAPAATELARALELDPQLETSEEVKKLRAKLKLGKDLAQRSPRLQRTLWFLDYFSLWSPRALRKLPQGGPEIHHIFTICSLCIHLAARMTESFFFQ